MLIGQVIIAKSAKQQLAAKKYEKVVILEKDFAGIKAGKTLYVGTPQIVDAFIRKIPFGETCSIIKLRNTLARRKKCDAMCPVSTAIFIRISAQAAIDELEAGAKTVDVAPFWRLLSSADTIAKKLSIDASWLDLQRQSEQASIG